MTMKLLAGSEQYDVEPLSDALPGWQGMKVMFTAPQINVAVGSTVELQGEGEGSLGLFNVSMKLGPAAPRGWRVFLQPATTTPSGSAGDNSDKVFLVKATKVMGGRRSLVEYKVSFSQLSNIYQRITRSGATITSITPSSQLG